MAILIAGMLITLGGLVYDGGAIATRQPEVIDAAWSLARTGAIQTRVDDGQTTIIDYWQAAQAIEDAQAAQFPDFDIDYQIGTDRVTVTVTSVYEPRMLNAIGQGPKTITASRTSQAYIPSR